MTALLYFSDISQLEHVLETDPGLLRSMRPMTGDMTVSYELERRGIEFVDEWDYLEPQDIEKNWNGAYSLSLNWWQGNAASSDYEGFNLADAACQDMVYSLEACLNARTAYRRIFDALGVERLAGYFLPEVGVARTGPAPTSRAVLSVTQGVLLYMAEQRKIPAQRLESGRPLSQARLAPRGRAPARKAKNPGKGAISGHGEGNPVLIYRDGFPDSEHAALLEILGSIPGIRPVSISSTELALGCEIAGPRRQRFQAFRSGFGERARAYRGDYPEIFANRHLTFQFERICEEMEKAADFGDVFASFLDALNPGLVFLGHEAFTVERVLVRLARRRSIPVAALLHGGAGFGLGFRGIVGEADHVLVWNEQDITFLESYGIERGRLREVGAIRYVVEGGQGEHAVAPGKKAARKQLGFDPERPLVALITAAVNTGFAAPFACPRRHRETLRAIARLAQSRPDLQFAIKPHPSFDYYALYRRLDTLAFPEGAGLDEMLDAADVCLMVNYCTTAALEAMLEHVPVVYLENAVYPLHDWRDNLSERGLCRVKTVDELERCVDGLVSEPEKLAAALREGRSEALRVLGENGNMQRERLRRFVGEVARPGVGAGRAGHGYASSYLAGASGLPRKGRMLMPYIMGAIKGGRGRGRFALARLLMPCLIQPRQFLSAPPTLRKAVASHLVSTMLGENFIGLIRKARRYG